MKDTSWNFKDLKNSKIRKNFIVIGDSISSEKTYANAGKTYCTLLCNELNANFKHNYAIGGTTVTYMYKGSNIEKEYKDAIDVLDGCRVAKNAYLNHELDDVDFAFIEYGHNDQYFQPELDANDENIDDIETIHSFKGSYRYIINLLRKANPKVKIIIMNCTYSEYSARSEQWKHILKYEDYMKAIEEIADECNCKYIAPWDILKPYFDGKTDKVYYHDDCHMSPEGHKVLASFLLIQ